MTQNADAKPSEKQLFHFFLFPDTEGSTPIPLSSNDLEQLKKSAYAEMVKAGSGWAYFLIDGVRCPISQPFQLFKIRKPDGSFTDLTGTIEPVFREDGHFSMLSESRSSNL